MVGRLPTQGSGHVVATSQQPWRGRQPQPLDPESWVDRLRSYVVLDQVVRDQRLFLAVRGPADSAVLETFTVGDQYRPGAYRLAVDSGGQRYTLATANGIVLERGTVGDSVGARLGFKWVPTSEALGAG